MRIDSENRIGKGCMRKAALPAFLLLQFGLVSNSAAIDHTSPLSISYPSDQLQIQSYNATGKTWRLGTYIGASGANRNFTIWETDLSNAMTILQASGNVGIGTVDPKAKLEVRGAQGIRTTDGANGILTMLGDNEGARIITGKNQGGNRNLRFFDRDFYTNAETELMRINSDGKVGIGTAAPQDKLQVSSSSSHNWISMERTSTAYENGLKWTDGGNTQFWFFMDNADNGQNLQLESAVAGASENDAAPRIRFPATNTDIYACLSGGKFGIGTSSAEATLHVAGEAVLGNLKAGYTSGAPMAGAYIGYKGTPELSYTGFAVAQFANGTTAINAPANGRINMGIGGLANGISIDATNGVQTIGDLKVNGTLRVGTVVATNWQLGQAPDYVFEKDYELAPLEKVESFVEKNKHLPDVPSAKQMKSEGLDLVKMNFTLLKKVEELTLHAIRQDKENKRQSEEIAQLRRELGRLR